MVPFIPLHTVIVRAIISIQVPVCKAEPVPLHGTHLTECILQLLQCMLDLRSFIRLLLRMLLGKCHILVLLEEGYACRYTRRLCTDHVATNVETLCCNHLHTLLDVFLLRLRQQRQCRLPVHFCIPNMLLVWYYNEAFHSMVGDFAARSPNSVHRIRLDGEQSTASAKHSSQE